MIPPLVALIATADERRDRNALDELLNRVRDRGNGLSADYLKGLSSPEYLPALRASALVPDQPGSSVVGQLLAVLTAEQLVPGLKSRPDCLSLQAGLYLIHDYLDASHDLAQQADKAGRNTTAPYWHGIMHRREPDYDNARYWFRRVGQHAIFPAVGREVAELLERQAGIAEQLRFDRMVDRRGHWDAKAFIDLCAECGRRWDPRAQAAAILQSIEMRLLLGYTCRAASEVPLS